jgi:hypothetical protein
LLREFLETLIKKIKEKGKTCKDIHIEISKV